MIFDKDAVFVLGVLLDRIGELIIDNGCTFRTAAGQATEEMQKYRIEHSGEKISDFRLP